MADAGLLQPLVLAAAALARRHHDPYTESLTRIPLLREKAAEAGVVAYAGNELRGFGNLLLIRHADGWITAYAHLDHLDVVRQRVAVRVEGVLGRVSARSAVGEGDRGGRDRPRDRRRLLRADVEDRARQAALHG